MQMLYFYLNLLAFVIVFVLGALSLRNRGEQYAKAFTLSMIFMGIWTFATGIELLAKGFELKLFGRNMTQIAMAMVPISTYWFVVRYADYKNQIFKFFLHLFSALTVIYVALLFTDQSHHLLRSKVELVETYGWKEIKVTSTTFGVLTVAARFAIFGLATLLLFVFLIRTYQNMKKQVVMILSGFVLALVLLLAKQYWLINIGVSVPMSVILIVPYIFVGIGIFKYDFLSIAPFAKEWIINSLEDGILMISNDGLIVEKNIAATELLEAYRGKIDFEDIRKRVQSEIDFTEEIEVESEWGQKYFQIKVHHLFTDYMRKRGSVAVIKDITVQKKQEKALIQKADYDGLTLVLNKQAIERAYVFIEKNPLSFIIIDIDHFKKVNDSYGHQIGDEVLVSVVNAMKRSIRKEDAIGRIGGDEFCIIMEDCDDDLCRIISERILEMIRLQEYHMNIDLSQISVSIGGVSNIPFGTMSFEKTFGKADEALYEAKNRGRNQAVITDYKRI